MIKGKAKMEFGTGDIRMTACLSGEVAALCCITQEPHEIGERVPEPESINALIGELADARDMMTGTYDGDLTEHDGLLDFDSFMKD